MKEKLLDLMKNEGLKPSQLAEMLEINPAGISHILAGRNKPGYVLLQKILRRFPQISPDWLMLDSPKMYRADTANASTMFPSINGGSNGVENGESNVGINGNNSPLNGGAMRSGGQSSLSSSTANLSVAGSGGFEGNIAGNMGATGGVNAGIAGGSSAAIGSTRGLTTTSAVKIVVFYTDNTFESFAPRHD